MTQPTPPLHLVGGASPTVQAELDRLRGEIEARNRQETGIAELGQAALTGVDPYILLGQACALVELTLDVEHARAIEISSGGHVVVRSSIGSNATFLPCQLDDEENESIAFYIALAGRPVTFDTDEEETRFKSTHLRAAHGVRCGAGVAIPTASRTRPFGVLIVYSSRKRVFADYELAFLQSAASLLGEAVERSHTEQAYRASESRLKQLIASTLDAVFTVDREGVVIEWNPQAEEAFGLPHRHVMGHPLVRHAPPSPMIDIISTVLERNHAEGREYLRRRIETRARRATGEEFAVEISIDPIGSGEEQTFTTFVRDISEQKQAQKNLQMSEQRFRAMVERNWSGVALLNEALAFSYAGASTERILGYTEQELIGTSLLGYVHPQDRQAARNLVTDLLTSPLHEAQGELRFRHRNGSWVWLEGFGQNLLHDPAVGAFVINYRDITQRKAAEKQLEYQAYYDGLTGLPNRLLFRDRVENALSQATRNHRGIAVLYLDLDHFKLVNDGLGHSLGDVLLAQVAARLQTCIRASDTLSRLGGDEFTILLLDTSSSEAVAGVARKILQSLERPFRVEGHELFVTASLGISLFPADGSDVETLLKCADSAMYRAKELGRNQTQLFTPSMNERYVQRLALEQSLHYALERQEMVVFYQPIFDRTRRRIVSMEALVRWRHPTRGLVGPSEFIGLAEETGLIIPLGEWVLRDSVAQVRRWRDEGLGTLKVSVNLSSPQLQQPNVVALVASILAENDVEPSSLELEITETVAVQSVELTMKVLGALRQLGVSVAIDDFGTGHSSLSYLRQFPIDAVKLDHSFIREVTTDDAAAAIVWHVIDMAHTLRLKVVAEGVETAEQYAFLKLRACDYVQGYLFSRPLPVDRAGDFLRRERTEQRHRL